MTPWDLIVWALAACAGLLALIVPVALVAAAASLGWHAGKLGRAR